MWFGDVFFDRPRHELRSATMTVRLRGNGVLLLALLADGAVHSREQIRAGMWSGRLNPPDDRSLGVELHHLRNKLQPFGIVINTLFGIGLQLVAPGPPRACPLCGSPIDGKHPQ